MELKTILSRTLRWGVSLASLTALAGGVLWLVREGGAPFEADLYRHFSYAAEKPDSYTTLHGIWAGLTGFTAEGWIQTGVLILILTPILRIVVSLYEFVAERDWLYAVISAVVLAVILANSFAGEISVR